MTILQQGLILGFFNLLGLGMSLLLRNNLKDKPVEQWSRSENIQVGIVGTLTVFTIVSTVAYVFLGL